MYRKYTHVLTAERCLAEWFIPSGTQLYYKRFSPGISISGTFGLHHVLETVKLSVLINFTMPSNFIINI